MIKGAQKQMIVVRTGGSKYFDEAYFVLRSDVRAGKGRHGDILREANRIIEESVQEGRGKVRRRTGAARWLCFAAGLLIGAGICLLLLNLFA